LLTGAGSTITSNAAATIQDSGGTVLGSVAAGQGVGFSRQADGSVAASWPGQSANGNPLRLVPAPGGILLVSGSNRHYRGEIWVHGVPKGLDVVNHLNIEEYLRGLGEVPSSWPVDAIAAQTVAARSYALYHFNGGGEYDGDDTTAFQVYLGSDRETASQNQAVAATAGQAVFYSGSIADTVYSSSDGGHTQCASQEWGAGESPCTPAYLKGVIDNYDVSPLHTWYTPPHTLAEIQGYLGATYNATSCGSLAGFDLSQRDSSDRLKSVRLVGSSGTCSVTPAAFINAINAGSPANFVVYGDMFGVTPGNGAWPYW
jgi:stage II sporulation protein D